MLNIFVSHSHYTVLSSFYRKQITHVFHTFTNFSGTDDMRAPEQTHYSRYPSRGIFRPVLNVDYPTWPSLKSIYDDPVHPSERINVPGYRYLPISRETYGISPRNIYPQNYTSPRYGKYT